MSKEKNKYASKLGFKKRLSISLTPETAKAGKDAAKKESRSFSNWVEFLILKELNPKP